MYHRELEEDLSGSLAKEKPERETGSRGREIQTESRELSPGVTSGYKRKMKLSK